jgi:pimeloyl-ACP methyl ester carboxylesterase
MGLHSLPPSAVCVATLKTETDRPAARPLVELLLREYGPQLLNDDRYPVKQPALLQLFGKPEAPPAVELLTTRMNIRYLQLAFRLCLPLTVLLGCSQSRSNAPAYAVGFKVVQAVDSARVYWPHGPATHYLHYRPLDLDVWYPAQPVGTKAALPFRDFLGLLEKRANYYTASTNHAGLTSQLAHSFSQLFACSDSTRVLAFPTHSFRAAAPALGKFPLVVYLASYNGMGYENIPLFETLANQGVVVVSVSSVGRYPGDMTMKQEDLLEQVQDAAYAVRLLATDPHVDASKIGIVGYSWGGLAGALLANRLPATACLVSLDGSEFHHYGTAKEDDDDFDGIKNSREFAALQLATPYLRLQSAPAGPGKPEGIFNFAEKMTAEKNHSPDQGGHPSGF